MNTAIHLATPAELEPLLALVARFHDEMGIPSDDTLRRAAVAPLLEGSPLGAAYLFGPARAPIGYVIVTFGWSLEYVEGLPLERLHEWIRIVEGRTKGQSEARRRGEFLRGKKKR